MRSSGALSEAIGDIPSVSTRKPAPESLWTRLRCSRCRYSREHPGPVTVADLDGECALCRAPLGAVTVYRLQSERAKTVIVEGSSVPSQLRQTCG